MILEAILKRKSIRNYKKDTVPEKLILELIEAAQFAPNSHHNRSLEVIVICENTTKEKLYDLLGQNFLKEAPLLLVPVIDIKKSTSPIQDIAVASENILLQATEIGLGTVWKNVNVQKIEEVKKILEVPDNFLLANIIPVGYIKTQRKPHNDKDFDLKRIHYEKW
jgi:nitroreductase